MAHFSKFSRRIKTTSIVTTALATFFGFVMIPFMTKDLFNVKAGYYMVEINGNPVGAANTREDADEAFAEARRRFSNSYKETVYLDVDYKCVEQVNLISKRKSVEELSNNIYTEMFSVSAKTDSVVFGYRVRIDDTVVTLDSVDDVKALFNRIIADYDKRKEYEVMLIAVEGRDDEFTIYVEKKSDHASAEEIIAAALNGNTVETGDGTKTDSDVLTSFSFDNSISISRTADSKRGILSVDKAYDLITSSEVVPEEYLAVEGDTIASIAVKFDMDVETLREINSYDEDSFVLPGDMVIVQDRNPIVNVVTTKNVTYKENYSEATRYEDDPESERGSFEVITEGEDGYHEYTAEVTYINGVESEKKIKTEVVTTKPVQRVVSVGTSVQSEYIKPVNGTFYKGVESFEDDRRGVDFKCNEGTPVKAAASGTVIATGWYSDYGYRVDIQHSDGTITRYAHLSQIKCNKGTPVNQDQEIGLSGSTGSTTESALHFEIIKDGVRVNPLKYVSK